MSTGSSKTSIYAAMAANIAIGVAKFAGAAISGSSAMLSEGIHSVVDSVNEVLLLYGLKKSEAVASEQFPLGRSQELYFWSLMVAVLIFALGGGVSVLQGVRSLQGGVVSSDPLVSYCVLAAAAVFEGAALTVSIRAFKKDQEDPDLGKQIFRGKGFFNDTGRADRLGLARHLGIDDSRNKQHRQVPVAVVGLDLLAERETVDPGHHHVGDDERRVFRELFKCLFAAAGGDHLELAG